MITQGRRTMTFEDACARYVHRFTMEHVPLWARVPCGGNGKFYAPHYRSDREWFERSVFPPNNPLSRVHCHSTQQTWPLGLWLAAPYTHKR